MEELTLGNEALSIPFLTWFETPTTPSANVYSLLDIGTAAFGSQFVRSQFVLKMALPLEAEDEIEEAYLRFAVQSGFLLTGDTFNHEYEIAAYLIDDSDLPDDVGIADVDTILANLTVARVTWNPTHNFTNSTFQITPNLKTIIDEVKALVGWANGNTITFSIRCISPSYDTGTGLTDAYTYFTFYANGAPEDRYKPKLIVKYSPFAGEIEHTINFNEIILGVLDRGSYEDTLEIEQDFLATIVQTRNYIEYLEFIEDYKTAQPILEDVSHYLLFQQQIVRGLVRNVDVEHTLNITEENTRNTALDKQIVHELSLEEDLVSIYVINRAVTDTLTIVSEPHANYRTVSVDHFLDVQQTFDYSDSTFHVNHNVISVLQITEDIEHTADLNREVIHDLSIRQAVLSFGTESDCRMDLDYWPQADATVLFPTEPVLVTSETILQYPFFEPTYSLTLPRPLFGDREELQLERVERQTRGGNLIVYRDKDYWTSKRILRYKFEGLTNAEIEDMFSFLNTTLGLEISLQDHEGRVWYGVIINPQNESGKFFRVCGNTAEFDFQGELYVPGPIIQNDTKSETIMLNDDPEEILVQ